MMLAAIGQLASWLINPWLLVAGALAVLLPILIHLLNRRQFRVVNWAAMDFLLAADKKNRRRIRLEHLILLVLRCLAVFLIGLVLARPFLPTSATAGLIDAARFERIVILDDSLSMQARLASESVWEAAKQRLIDLTSELARQSANSELTLILTSQANQRLLNAVPLHAGSSDDIKSAIERLEASDGVAQIDAALHSINDYISSQPANVNRVVYLLTDLRVPDWGPAGESGPLESLAQLSKKAQGCYLIDVGDNDDRNLTIAEIRPEATLLQGVASAFDVVVKNQGSAPARDVRVNFSIEGALPLVATIDQLAAGETTSVQFHTIVIGGQSDDDVASRLPPQRVQVELQTAERGADDRLHADSVAFFAARPLRAIEVLIIDGDASIRYGQSESFYLSRALAPAGPVSSGILPEVVPDGDVDLLALNKYAVVFLLNCNRLGDKTADNIEQLERWVAAGGGLVIMPGDQIEEPFYNTHFWRDGRGLSPLKLERIRGDKAQTSWISLRVVDANHEVLKPFGGQSNPLLENVKVFRWWGSAASEERSGSEIGVLARLSDSDDSPAIAEKALGNGRVVAFAVPADADWHNWTSDPSYLLIMQDFVRHLAKDRLSRGTLRVGDPIRQPVDLGQYELNALLNGPRELKANLQAAPPAQDDLSTAESTTWQAEYPAAAAQGFYELKLTRRDGGSETQLFAVNIDSVEGNLTRVDRDQLERRLAGTNVRLMSAAQLHSLTEGGQQSEIWRHLLWLLIAVLACEQLLGWFFGRARS
jgi:Aerotolerance regulator N-terminal/von Willebrand factor type A domain/CARDB